MKKIEINEENLAKAQYKLRSLIEDGDFKKVVTNIQLGAALVNTFIENECTLNIEEKTGTSEYQIGVIKNIKIFIDPMMNWDDTRLICDDEEILIEPSGLLI